MPHKLTAEQVRDAVMSADRWEKPMGNTGLTNTHLIIRDDGWQAIADELNATLGAGTCHWEYPQGVNGWVGYIVCSNCQHQFSGVDEREWTCCPVCGARVEGADR